MEIHSSHTSASAAPKISPKTFPMIEARTALPGDILNLTQCGIEQQMRTTGRIPPICLFVTEKGMIVHSPASFKNDADKQYFVDISKIIAAAHNATAVATAIEAWMVPARDARVEFERVSKDPGPQEIVVISVETRQGCAWRLLPIQRDGNGAFSGFGEVPSLPDPAVIVGRFTGILPAQPVCKRVRAIAKRGLRQLGWFDRMPGR